MKALSVATFAALAILSSGISQAQDQARLPQEQPRPLVIGAIASPAQAKPSPAATATGKAGKANVTIKYSSPAVKGRKIWGELVPYGEVWRAGANEATTVTFDKPVMVEGKPLAAGTYAFFILPTEQEWTVIFNKDAKQWGAFTYDVRHDAMRVAVKPIKAAMHERLDYTVVEPGIIMRWENMELPVSIK